MRRVGVVECRVWSLKSSLWGVKSSLWSVECEERSVECGMELDVSNMGMESMECRVILRLARKMA